MSSNLPDFEKAQYAEPVAPVVTEQGFVGSSWGAEPAGDKFMLALTYGLGAAIVGSLIYAAFTIVTHIEIGYLAVGVGYLIGKAMLYAEGGAGGRRFQIAAAILTYFAVSMAAVPEILYSIHKNGHDISHISGRGMLFLAKYGILSPFLELENGIGGFIGLFILFIGIRAAWNLTADRRGVV
jgi:hypothetical protein